MPAKLPRARITAHEQRERAEEVRRWLRRYDLYGEPVVYVLSLGRRVVYVGATQDLHHRLARHDHTRPPTHTPAGRAYDGEVGAWYDKAEYVRTPRHLLLRRERALIAYLQPVYNAPVMLDAVLRAHLRSMDLGHAITEKSANNARQTTSNTPE